MTYPTGIESRRDRILESAARTFAAQGYQAASLREIARDAGCALTLVDHHFGTKARLLHAVVEGHHENCRRRMAPLRAANEAAVPLTLPHFVARWVDYEFDLQDTPEGRQYLRLMLRLTADNAVDPDVRRGVNCAESVVTDGLRRARPELPASVLRLGWQLASAALYSVLIAATEHDPAAPALSDAALRAQAAAFVVGGLEAAWSAAPA